MLSELVTADDRGEAGAEINAPVLDWGGGDATSAGAGKDRGFITTIAAAPRLTLDSMPFLMGKSQLRIVLIGPPVRDGNMFSREDYLLNTRAP